MSGIRTLEDLRIRCVVNAETNCWRYPTSISEEGLPRVAIPPGVLPGDAATRWTVTTGRKAGWLLAGKPLKKGQRVYALPFCDERACCNPEHTKAARQSSEAKKWVRRGLLATITSRQNTSVQAASMEQLQEVLRLVAERLTDREIAVLVGLHPQTVGKMRHGRHQHQRPLPTASSIFALGATA